MSPSSNVMEIFKTPKDIIMILGKLIGFKNLTPFFFELDQRKLVKKAFNIQAELHGQLDVCLM